jgi:SpoVK/Ycf46/Vps4 family AAA+-type ATPase
MHGLCRQHQANLCASLTATDAVDARPLYAVPGHSLCIVDGYRQCTQVLDAALIRPGRVDKILYFGHIQYSQARQMLEHYYQ